jgi:ABC-type phosphate transport system substrate-binding protein
MKRLLAMMLLLIASGAAHAASFKVIVNESVNVRALPKKSVSDLFLKKSVKWEGGQPVVVVDQIEASQVRDAFSRSVHGKPAAAIKSYWTQQIFSGRAVPPVEKKTDADVLAFVRANAGAIGYVADTTATDGVRVLEVK